MAPIFKTLAVLSFTILASAQQLQFITGPCANDAACASGCCNFRTGLCAAPIVAKEAGDSCGFGSGVRNNNALNGIRSGAAAVPAAVGAAPVSTIAPGTQFITGPCTSDADCQAGCCGFNTGKCAGPVIAQERDGGCGFGDAQPNDTAAKKFLGQRLGRRGPAMM